MTLKVPEYSVGQRLEYLAFQEGMRAGHYESPSAQDIEANIQRMWAEPALSQLTEPESNFLYHFCIARALSNADSRSIAQLAGTAILHMDGRNSRVLVGEQAEARIQQGETPLTPQQKIDLFSNPMVTGRLDVATSSDVGTIHHHGIRPAFMYPGQEGYNLPFETFTSMLHAVATRTGKSALKIGDLGYGNGMALWDTIEHEHGYDGITVGKTTGFALDEEIDTWPIDEVVLTPAERIPRRYRETQDVLLSHYTIVYCVYPDLALENALRMTSVGGEMYTWFDYHKSPLYGLLFGPDSYQLQVYNPYHQIPAYEGPDLFTRVRMIYKWVRELEKQGYISMVAKPKDREYEGEPSWGLFNIVVNKSLQDVPSPSRET